MLKVEFGCERGLVRGDFVVDAEVHGEGVGLVAAVDGLVAGLAGIIYVIVKASLGV